MYRGPSLTGVASSMRVCEYPNVSDCNLSAPAPRATWQSWMDATSSSPYQVEYSSGSIASNDSHSIVSGVVQLGSATSRSSSAAMGNTVHVAAAASNSGAGKQMRSI